MRGRFEFGLPVIDLDINGHKVSCLLDTGFNGDVLLPEEIIQKLNLKLAGEVPYMNVDGKIQITEVYVETRV